MSISLEQMCMRGLCKVQCVSSEQKCHMSPTWLSRTPSLTIPPCCPPSQGKSFVKDALRCMALGLRQRFSCVSRRCSAVKEMVYSLQRECYAKHQLCLALQDHMDTMGNLIQFHLMFPPG